MCGPAGKPLMRNSIWPAVAAVLCGSTVMPSFTSLELCTVSWMPALYQSGFKAVPSVPTRVKIKVTPPNVFEIAFAAGGNQDSWWTRRVSRVCAFGPLASGHVKVHLDFLGRADRGRKDGGQDGEDVSQGFLLHGVNSD